MNVGDAYAAGIFDGEGYVGLRKRLATSGKNGFSVAVAVAMTDPSTIKWLVKRYGGTYGTRTIETRKKIAHLFRLNGKFSVKFLESIEPYLINKRAQVKLALRYIKLVQPKRNNSLTIAKRRYAWKCYYKLKKMKRIPV